MGDVEFLPMSKISFQGKALLLSLMLSPWMAFGQAGPSHGLQGSLNLPSESRPSAAESLLPLLGSSTRVVKEWTAGDAGVLQELRRGLTRLEKGCAQKAGTAGTEPPAAPSASVQSLQETLALRESSAAAFERWADQWNAQTGELVAKQCAGASNSLGLDLLKSSACKQAETVRQGVQGLRSELGRYHSFLAERYRTYGSLARLEQQACARPGFTARLMLANDTHMRPAELRRWELAEQWDKDITELLRKLWERP